MRVACVQFDIAWQDKPANAAKVRALLDAAGGAAGGLIALPEMFSTGFSMDLAATDEGADRPAEALLTELARRHGSHVLGGVVRRADDGRGLNQALLVGPDGSQVLRYTKMHPFSYAGETAHFAAGDSPVLASLPEAVISAFICYDLRFPEVFRSAVAAGAEVLVVLANWPAVRADHWRTLLRARAIENQAFVVGVNRVGQDPNMAYAGGSIVVGPRGEVLAEAGSEEAVLAAELDLADLRDYRRAFPVLQDLLPAWVRPLDIP